MNLFSKNLLAGGVAILALNLPAYAINPGHLPLWFEAGRNQPGEPFVAHAPGAEFAVTTTGADISLQANGQTGMVRMQFISAKPAAPEGIRQLPGKINYLLGNNSSSWQFGVPTFAQVALKEIYPGISVVYYGNQQQLEYDFKMAAGADPASIAIRFEGAQAVSVNAEGCLVISLPGGQIIQHRPVAYQLVGGERRAVAAGYKIIGAQTVGFTLGGYDRTQPLVIDPTLSFASYFGGNKSDCAWAVAVNPSDDSIFIAGQTLSTLVSNNIPFASHGFDSSFNGGAQTGDAFVAKFDSTGTNLIYCTYLGGKNNDAAYALAVDSAGHAFIAGYTDSTDFPVRNAPQYGAFNGATISGTRDPNTGYFSSDAFVSELETNGASLVYSTYLGGGNAEAAYGLTIDPAGNAFVTGITFSTNFPATDSAFAKHPLCTYNAYLNANAFVTEIAASGGKINYSTYLGGTNYDSGRAIAFNNGNIFVAGFTASTNFPWTNGLTAGTNLNGSVKTSSKKDAFVSMFTMAGTNLNLAYSTFLGGTNNEVAQGIAADSAGNAYVVGWTTSTNFPVTTNGVELRSFIRTNKAALFTATNAFITKLQWDGTNASLGYSQIFGGYGVDVANGVALDSAGDVFIIGSASSKNFPVTSNSIFGSLRATNTGASDAFVLALPADFSSLLWSAYLGGTGKDFGNGIAADSANNVVIAGQTFSPNFPVYAAAHSVRDGIADAFFAKINAMTATPALSIAGFQTTSATARAAATPAGSGADKSLSVVWHPVGQATPQFLSLETATNPAGNNWKVVNDPPVLTNGDYVFKFNPTNAAQFFRIAHP